jgi:hypothetical protein
MSVMDKIPQALAMKAANPEMSWKQIADSIGVNYDSLRGRKSEYIREQNVQHLKVVTTSNGKKSRSDLQLDDYRETGWQEWESHLAKLRNLNRFSRLAFVSDAHLPYQDNDAVEHAAKIVEDFNPDICTDFSDVFELMSLGRWDDGRKAFEKVWDNDIFNVIEAHKAWSAIWRDAAPNAIRPALIGNHDYRLVSFLQKNAGAFSSYSLANLVEDFISHGTTWLGEELIDLELSPGLLILHGISATKNRATAAKNHHENPGGSQRSTVAGHVHAFGQYVVRGRDYDMYNHVVGCLADLQPPYSNRRQAWQQGILLGWYDPNGHYVSLSPVPFFRTNGHMISHFGDKEYRTKITNG